jgi:acyl dehydratase
MNQTTPDAAFPRRVEIPIRLDDNPRYKGSVHDDEVARRLGYKAALVPGAFVYGHMSRLAIEAWGTDWARRGRMFARFRRPVYNGDVLAAEASALERSPDGLRAAVTMRNEDGEEVATGWIGLPEGEPAPPPIESLPVEPLPDPRRAVGPGGITVGMRVGSRNTVLTREDVRISLSAFDERHPLYTDPGFVHSGCLVRLAMADTNQSFDYPSPVVFVAGEAQHYGLVFPGQRLATSGTVTAAYERKGKHYFESEEYLIADGAAVVARFRRTSIYA